ncbi:MAG: SDR family NAD(P)-dependent oxidoreductase [Gemmatimonadota bacterium]|nr:SDR family NAD(P)-dependent oxidoreductase [Gemmatimonadota bacterium]
MAIGEIERIIQAGLMGQIYGMKAALPHMRLQGKGTIINVAPTAAAEHGIAGFTEALRRELAQDGTPIHVALVIPAVPDGNAVAEAILAAAGHPRREIVVGSSRKYANRKRVLAGVALAGALMLVRRVTR